MPRGVPAKPTDNVEEFRTAAIRVGLKICEDFMNGKTPDKGKSVEAITMLFNAVK